MTFHYSDAQTQRRTQRCLSLADFLWKLLQHVLPPGFHRVREYGFVHANAFATLRLVQYVLQAFVSAPVSPQPTRPCPHCHSPMRVTLILSSHRPVS